MTVDATKIRANNLIATSPGGTHTILPTKVTQLSGNNNWEYEWPNTWPTTGVWVVTVNEDGLATPKGTVIDSITVTQGVSQRTIVPWGSIDRVTTLEGKVAALETDRTAKTNQVAALEADRTAKTIQIAAMLGRLDQLEFDVFSLQNP